MLLNEVANQRKIEGYWGTSPEDKTHPWPVQSESWSKDAGKDGFLKNLYKVQLQMKPKGYRGYSICRLCGMRNGSTEYEDDKWTWPVGFAHYADLHSIKPSGDFVKYINDKANPV